MKFVMQLLIILKGLLHAVSERDEATLQKLYLVMSDMFAILSFATNSLGKALMALKRKYLDFNGQFQN